MGNKKLAFINKDMLVWARKETPFDKSPEQVSEHFPKISSEKLKNGNQVKNYLPLGRQKRW